MSRGFAYLFYMIPAMILFGFAGWLKVCTPDEQLWPWITGAGFAAGAAPAFIELVRLEALQRGIIDDEDEEEDE